MRAMIALVSGMGVLIVAGVIVLVVTIATRLSTPSGPLAATLDEPPGTRMGSVAPFGDRLALLLTGGGPDRLVLVDPRSGRVVGRVGLAR